jgi:FkbH-like protein
MKLEVISNINMDSLKFYMKDYEFIESCSFGNFLIDLNDENSSIYKSESEFVILFLDLQDELDIDELLSAIKKFLTLSNKTLIINSCSYQYYIDTYLHNLFEKELKFNLELIKLTKEYSNLLLFNFHKILREHIFDNRYWYLGRIKFNKKGFELIAKEIDNLIKTYKYGSKKVLVLDLDNTLWGGIIGEEEIELSNDGVGKIYLDFQKNIKKLKNQGVLLAICSKNNYEDGIKGLNHINSVLKEEDFIIKKINWQDKATNIKEIAKELNLGEEALVFIDDNPVEREIVKQMTNAIVVDFPEDIYNLNDWFIKEVVEKYFAKISLTDEDKRKQEQYLAKIKREQIAKKMNYEEFLKSLKIELQFFINDKRFIKRYAQMTQKTNQFNLTTKRYTENDIKNFLESNEYDVIAVNYKDKFANEGITALAIIKKENDIHIDTFLLSCRVIKRKVEDALIRKIFSMYKNKKIYGYYYPTKKNMQVKDMYLNFGFKKINENTFLKEN